MYVCKDCGNYYQFDGSANTTITNKIYATGRSYRAEVEEEIDNTEFIHCMECDEGAVVNIDIKALPERLQEEIYNTATMGCIDKDVMKNLKEFVNK